MGQAVNLRMDTTVITQARKFAQTLRLRGSENQANEVPGAMSVAVVSKGLDGIDIGDGNFFRISKLRKIIVMGCAGRVSKKNVIVLLGEFRNVEPLIHTTAPNMELKS